MVPEKPPRAGTTLIAPFVEHLRTLDQSAWAALYDRHHPRIFRYAYARTGSRDVAEDVAAETFARALAPITGFAPRLRAMR